MKSSGIVNNERTMESVWRSTWMKKPSGMVWCELRGEFLKINHVGMMAKTDMTSMAKL